MDGLGEYTMKSVKVKVNPKNLKRQDNPTSLPPFRVEKVIAALSQVANWGITKLKIPNTWTVTKGEDMNVLVIDTGCPCIIKNGKPIVHPDLDGAILVDKCKSFVSGEGIEDLNGHSSHCAGIIGARDNEVGAVGYAPICNIITYKALDKNGSGTMKGINDALKAAITLKPDVVSMSLGCQYPDPDMERAIKKLFDMNIPVIAAGGNGGEMEGVNYPGNYDETITIGAYDVSGAIADFSAVGPGIDFAFPGVDIYSTYLKGAYCKMSGTCLKKGTKVYTSSGLKKIEDIEVDEIVFSLNQKNNKIVESKVQNVINNGIKKTYKVKTPHETIFATDNHPFLVKEEQNITWKQLKDIKVDDKIAVVKNVNYCDSNISNILNDFLMKKHKELTNHLKQTSGMPTDPIVMSDNLCQFIGAFLGDGYINTNRKMRTGLAGVGLCVRYGYKQQNESLPSDYNQIFKSAFNGLEMTERDNGDLFIYSEYLANVFEGLGLFETAHTKRIPDWIFKLNNKQKIAVLSGLIDTDGWIGTNGNLVFEFCNKDLLEDIRCLCNMVGVKFGNIYTKTHNGVFGKYEDKVYNAYTRNTTQIKRIENDLTIKDKYYNKFLSERNDLIVKDQKYMNEFDISLLDTDIVFNRITEITESDEENVYDLTIENNHNFIAEGIIVHNSMATPAAAGVVALLIAKHRAQEKITGKNDCVTVDQIKEHLKKYSEDVGPANKDNWFGYGIVDVEKMIAQDNEFVVPPVVIPTPVPVPTPKAKKSLWERFLDWLILR